MNKQELLAQLEYFDMVHGVTLRAIAALNDDELAFRPKPKMRTPRELIFHIYSQEKELAEAVRQGRFTMEAANRSNPESDTGAAGLKTLATVREAQRYAQECHRAAARIFKELTDEALARPVESPFG